MPSKTYKAQGIVLARKDYSEADRILILYTKEFGKISLVAKGVRKPKSRKRGHLEVFSHIKFSAAKTKSLPIITEAETLNNFSPIRKNLKKISVAYFLLETIGRLTRDEEKNPQLFNLLLTTLKKLQSSNQTRILREDFIKQSLVILGFWPKSRPLYHPDEVLESITEKKINSARVAKKILS